MHKWASKTKSDIEKKTPYYFCAIDWKKSFFCQNFLIPVLKMILTKRWIYRNRQIKRVNFIDFEQIYLKPNFQHHIFSEKPIISGRTKNSKFLISPRWMILSWKSPKIDRCLKTVKHVGHCLKAVRFIHELLKKIQN